jgi:SAM-dependent methyltransferase
VRRSIRGMREYWDGAAHRSAAYYVDTRMDFDHPDMDVFFETGRQIVNDGLHRSPVLPAGRSLALEIGSGLGRNCVALLDDFDEVIGIDIAPEMVRRARELVGDPRVRFEVGTGADLATVSDASVDFVLSFTVFQHIPDVAVIERYIAEAGRVLRPGGVFSFQWNNRPRALVWRARSAVLSALQRSGLRPERRRRHARQFLGSRVPRTRIERALSGAGLTIAGTENLGTMYAWCWSQKG